MNRSIGAYCTRGVLGLGDGGSGGEGGDGGGG